MEPHSKPPTWLEIVSWITLIASFASAAYILSMAVIALRDVYGVPHPVFWPRTTALYFGPAAAWFYHAYGRPKSEPIMACGSSDDGRAEKNDGVRWNQTAESLTHCGAGCTIVDEWAVLIFGFTIPGNGLYAAF